MVYSAVSIANEFIRLAKDEDRPITNMQLQKLPYIAHGWSLALLDQPLISEHPKVWQYGPVYPSVYDALKIYGADPIDDYIYDNKWNPFVGQLYGDQFKKGNIIKANLTDVEKELINTVWNVYKEYDAFQLSALTHQPNTPWSIIKERDGEGCIIDNETIKKHYLELSARNNNHDSEKQLAK
ncbi:MAG: hypothetical protein [Bacteriophage sp.]|nr:MAG: hypothetical protein [Bacteriophage sp.]